MPSQNGLSLLQFDIEDAQGHVFLHQSFLLNKPKVNWTGHGDTMQLVQQSKVRIGRKPTLAESIKQKDRLPLPYLLPMDNSQVKADVLTEQREAGQHVSFTLTPDTADVFHAEVGLAYLLDASIDRVQWIGKGPFPSYPGRYQANRYGFWAMQAGDLYFEGNRMGVDAAYLSDKDGNGLLIVGDSLCLNFEQTDRGIVLTVNADVAGQGPKFARTAFPVASDRKDLVASDREKSVAASFDIYRIEAGKAAQIVTNYFVHPQSIPAPFRPFMTQYDTYLMKYDIISQ